MESNAMTRSCCRRMATGLACVLLWSAGCSSSDDAHSGDMGDDANASSGQTGANTGTSGSTATGGSGTTNGSAGGAGSDGAGSGTASTNGMDGSDASEGAGAGSSSSDDAAGDPQGAPDAGLVGSDAGESSAEARGTGPGDWGPGDYPPNLMAEEYLEISGVAGQNGARQYKVHVPPSYDPDVPTPLLFCIHGLGQTAVLFCLTGAAMHTRSDEAGFIVVMPNGYQNSWNGGSCCGGASAEQLDDVALFRAIFEEVGTHLNVDLDRVYATGLSNGGYMSYRLACEAADMVTAIAPGAGAIGKNDIGGGTNPMSDFTQCEPSQPVSVLALHGTADPLIPYSLVEPSLQHMAAQNGCSESTRAASVPTSAGDTTCISYDSCPEGIELTGCTVEGGGHCWFGSGDCGTGGGAIGMAIVGANSDTLDNTQSVWEFFSRLSR